MRHFGVLSLTQHHQRSDSIRCAFLYYFLSFPFRHHQSQLKAKLVPNSHPFSIEYPHQSTTLAFRVFGFLSLHTIPYHTILFFLGCLIIIIIIITSSSLTTLSTNPQKMEETSLVFFFILVFFFFFGFCFVCCTSFLVYWNGFCCFIWTLQVYVYPKVKVREQEDQEDFKGPSLLPSNDDSSFLGITCFSLSYLLLFKLSLYY